MSNVMLDKISVPVYLCQKLIIIFCFLSQHTLQQLTTINIKFFMKGGKLSAFELKQ
jgi:hypothetical protein